VNDGHAERIGFQRGARADRAAIEFYAALEIAVDAGENFDERAFARAVFAGQDMDLPGAALELNVAQNRDRPEALGDACQAHQ
jgi:hypothetical protein